MNPLEKAKANPRSMRSAINAFCYYCMGSGGDGEGTTKRLVGECESTTCPLWALRPWQRSAAALGVESAPIRAHEEGL